MSSLDDEQAKNGIIEEAGPDTGVEETAPPAAEQAPALDQDARLKALEEENSQLKDQYLRKQADFENYRKRMQREAQEFRFIANRQLILDLIPIIDDFERALKSAEESKDFTAFFSGVALIEKQFVSMLERKWALKRFESVGEEFNPERHEAILSEAGSGQAAPRVIEDYQKGYLLNDKVLRASKVKVQIPGPQTTTLEQ